jgi:hypothetical protein
VKGAHHVVSKLRFRASYTILSPSTRAKEGGIMTTTTARFAQLLRDAQAWDERYQELCHAQTEYLLSHFCFADNLCRYVDPATMAKWNVPQVVGKYFRYTECK